VPNITQALKSELGAALAVSAGVLVATGYLITWARLANERLPTEAVLAALPKTFYLGVAVQSLVLPLFVLITLGVAFVIGAWHQHIHDEVPTRVEWAVFGLALALYASFFANLLNPFATASRDASYAVPAIITGLVVIAITYGIGRLAQARLEWVRTRKEKEGHQLERGDRLRVVVSAVVIACVVTVSLVRIVDARYAPRALPEAAVFTDREDCPEPASAEERAAPGCLVTGFYIGESDQWLYLVAPQERLVPGEARRKLPGRVYFLPRGSVHQLRLAKDLSRGIPASAPAIPTSK
jgi:uncharacterized membrane protein YidH (DUF202 family)